MEAMLRLLFLGENWFGSCARACSYALRRLGCDVKDFDAQTFFPQLRLKSSRALVRLAIPRLIKEYNQQLLEAAECFQPDFLLAFKGTYVLAETLRELRRLNIPLYNYYPDRILLARGTPIERAISEYDCVFDTKCYWDGDACQHYRVRKRVFLPHGYDPEVHRPCSLDKRDREQFACDVSLIASHMPIKEEIVASLIRLRPKLDLRIWGNQWREHCRSRAVQKLVRGPAINGFGYSKAVLASRINLALMGVTPNARDETSTRTYEIPACGGFMLHERTAEVQKLFVEDREIACFGSIDELAEKIEYYLARPDERLAIARCGNMRCVPAYSYDVRMAEILRWHCQREKVLPEPPEIAATVS